MSQTVAVTAASPIRGGVSAVERGAQSAHGADLPYGDSQPDARYRKDGNTTALAQRLVVAMDRKRPENSSEQEPLPVVVHHGSITVQARVKSDHCNAKVGHQASLLNQHADVKTRVSAQRNAAAFPTESTQCSFTC